MNSLLIYIYIYIYIYISFLYTHIGDIYKCIRGYNLFLYFLKYRKILLNKLILAVKKLSVLLLREILMMIQ
jgi:hypothetical protein